MLFRQSALSAGTLLWSWMTGAPLMSSAFVVSPLTSNNQRTVTINDVGSANIIITPARSFPPLFVGDAPEESEHAAEPEEELSPRDSADAAAAADEQQAVAAREDPELVALKEEIANQESVLKAKRSTLSRLHDDVDKYSSAGYARRVAQMEDMKRIRLSMQSSNKDTSVASVLTNFIPVLDELRALKEEYSDDDFGSKYSGLAGAMMASLKELGVEEYACSVGDAVDAQRVSVIEEEYSSDIPKGSVIRPVSMGMELSGNVMRLAQVVASLGSAEDAAAAASDAPTASQDESPPPTESSDE